MAAPSPFFIVDAPPPLNATDFPFAVQPFPAVDLGFTVGLFHSQDFTPAEPLPDNANRY